MKKTRAGSKLHEDKMHEGTKLQGSKIARAHNIARR